MNRPSLLAVVVLAILVSTGWVTETICAQQTATARTIGVVAPGFSVDSDEGRAFREGLRAAGYEEGRDLSIDWWYGHGSYKGVDDAVGTLVRNKVDLIVVESTVAALAAKRATQTIPIEPPRFFRRAPGLSQAAIGN